MRLSSPAAAEALTAGLKELQCLLEEHALLRREQAPTARKDREIRGRLADIELELVPLYEEVVAILDCAETDAPMPLPDETVELDQDKPVESVPEVLQVATDDEDTEGNPPSEPDDDTNSSARPGALEDEQNPPNLDSETHEEAEAADGEGAKLEAAVWRYAAAGNYVAAYWLSHGVADRVAPWLFKACVLGNCVQAPGDEPGGLLASIIYDHPDPSEAMTGGRAQKALVLGATGAVRAALCAPETGAIHWLEAARPLVDWLPFLHPLIEFAGTGIPFGPDVIMDGQTEEERRQSLANLRQRATQWQAQQASTNLKYHLASEIMHFIASERHPVGQAIAAVINDNRDDYGLARRVLDEELAEENVSEFIEGEARRLHRGPLVPRIVGVPRDTMMSRLADLRRVLSDWCRLVRQPMATQAGWRENKIAHFREEFRKAWSPYQDAPPSIPQASPALGGLIRGLWQEVRQLAGQWILPGTHPQMDGDTGRNWMSVLRRPLVHLVPSPIARNRSIPDQLTREQSLLLLDSLERGEPLKEAIQRQLDALDFYTARCGLEEPEVRDDKQLQAEVEDRQLEASERFQVQVAAIRRDLELSTVLHIVMDSERSEFEGRLLSLESLESKELRYGRLFSECDQVACQLAELRRLRLDSLGERIAEMDRQIEEAEGAVKEVAAKYRAQAVKALHNSDLAVADELFSLAERTLQKGEIEDEAREPGFDYDRFRTTIERLSKELEYDDRRVRDALAAAKGIKDVLDQAQIPGARKVEIASALDAFRFFKSGRPTESKDHCKWIGDIVTYLGFRPPTVKRTAVTSAFWHYQVRTTDAGASPLPHFGSHRNGLYDLLVVWDRPNAERLGQIVQEAQLASRSPIILFLGRITNKQREEWGGYCLKHELTAMLVDEGLLYYLAGVRENRLRACVAYSLPWGYANPYTPVAGGLVAPEMFVGRKSTIRDLADPMGSVIIYGGRQLGKSAILRAIERDYHRPDRKESVFFNDIRNLGGTQDNSELWRQLRDWAALQKIIDPKVLDQPGNLTNELVKYFDKNPEARIRLLLDEADNFLKTDARRNFREIQYLKTLMDRTDRRFKVVLSGLHSVQRYCTVPNHPFAHLNPISVGPLDPADARSLIVEPMQMLGFSFSEESEHAIYRILALTNYQPALIQHVCMELVRGRRSVRPPYRVTVKMIEDLSRQASVRRFISERFTWTVGLDPRYEGLVYSMILEQSGDRDGFRREFSARQALELARAWWHKGFEKVPPEEAASLLNELVGLGVLVRLESGMFRLRNANVVRMLGSLSEIEERMGQLAETEPEPETDPRHVRQPLEGRAWSPLTLEQEACLLRQQAGINMVFCSDAQGRSRLTQAVQRLARGSSGSQTDGNALFPPPECLSIDTFRTFLEKALSGKDSGRYFVVLSATHLMNFADPPAQTLSQMAALLRNRRAGQRLLQLVVTFTGKEVAQWYARPEAAGQEDENLASYVAVCAPWGREMVRHSLRHYGMIDNESVVESIMRATAGWPLLIDAMMARVPGQSLENAEPRPACEEVLSELAEQGTLSASFLDATGINDLSLGRAILKMVVELEPGDFGDITADLVAGAEGQGGQAEIDRQVKALQRLTILRRDGDAIRCDPVLRVALGI